jgi:CRP/FNR family cyclic AMP-dependent transcriptional regulator
MEMRRKGTSGTVPSLAGWPKRTVLGTLSAATRKALLGLGPLREYPAASTLIMEGETSTDVFVLVDGWVKIVGTTEDGGLALLALRVGGDIVGEQAALDGRPRTASVICAGATSVHVIRQADFLRFLSKSAETSLAVSRALSAKLRWANQRRIDFSGLDVGTRLARVLGELARLDGHWVANGIDVGYQLTQPELAAMVGASEPSVHKALRQFRRDGVVATGYRTVVITDLAALDAIATAAWPDAPPAAG